MSRTARTPEDIRALFGETGSVPPPPGRQHGGGKKRRTFSMGSDTLDWTEVVSLACRYHCKGWTAPAIQKQLDEVHGVKLRREDPYLMVLWAAANDMLQFVPKLEHTLSQRIRTIHPALDDVEVVQTRFFDDVATRGGSMLLRLVQKHHCANPSRSEVHVGFAGGYSMWKLARAFARLLRSPVENLPKVLVFHSLVSSFNPQDPRTDPNAFVLYFMMEKESWIETQFVGFPAPGMVHTSQIPAVQALPGISSAYDARHEIDIIVTSASLWSDADSMLCKHMKAHGSSFDALQNAGCLGDILWRPLGKTGPIEISTEMRAMTIFELSDLPGLIRNGKHVLLVLGPCGGCNRPKGEILRAVLNAEEPLISHLVVDTRSARELYLEPGQVQNAA